MSEQKLKSVYFWPDDADPFDEPLVMFVPEDATRAEIEEAKREFTKKHNVTNQGLNL